MENLLASINKLLNKKQFINTNVFAKNIDRKKNDQISTRIKIY